MKRTLRLPALALTLLLLAIPTLAVLAKEISSLTVSGPGIQGEITLDGKDDMLGLMDAGLIDNTGAMAAPKQTLGTPYTITVNLNLDGKIVPFIRIDYYPMQAGQAGYVHTTGRLDGSSLRKADEWSVMPLKADNLLRSLLRTRGIELQAAVQAPAAEKVTAPEVAPPAVAPAVVAPAAAAPKTSSLPIQPLYFALLAVLIVLAGAGVLLRRKALSR